MGGPSTPERINHDHSHNGIWHRNNIEKIGTQSQNYSIIPLYIKFKNKQKESMVIKVKRVAISGREYIFWGSSRVSFRML